MPANQHDPYSEDKQPCRGNCTGYGTQCFCPPLIVLAMHDRPLPLESCFSSVIAAAHKRASPSPDLGA